MSPWSLVRRFLVVLALAALVPRAALADDIDTPDAAPEATDTYADTDPSALTEWRAPLAPYGAWVVDADYGTVWVPHAVVVGRDFAPYVSSGHWELGDDDAWIWVSDYPWGWIPFHYGRWVWIRARGWAWIPGRVYAPAWVVWRVGDGGFVGWAPTPPAWYWVSGVAVSLWVIPPAPFVFCPTAHVFDTHVHHHVVRDHRVVQSAAASTRPYKPASARRAASPQGAGTSDHASKGGPGRGSSSAGTPGSGHRIGSPSPTDAHLPRSVTPRRGNADARALAYSRRSTTPGPHAGGVTGRRGTPGPSGGGGFRSAPGAPSRHGREPFSANRREPFSLPEAGHAPRGTQRSDVHRPPPVGGRAPVRAPSSAPAPHPRDLAPSVRPPSSGTRAPAVPPRPAPRPGPAKPAVRRR